MHKTKGDGTKSVQRIYMVGRRSRNPRSLIYRIPVGHMFSPQAGCCLFARRIEECEC